MLSQIAPSRFSIFTAAVAIYISFSFGLTDLSAQSSCVSCHTQENLLKKNLAPKEEKKSAMTSGAG
jgi:nitrate/TMAO reductase-like tetraheme cytochrome c subunit